MRYSKLLVFAILAVALVFVGCSQVDEQSNPVSYSNNTDQPAAGGKDRGAQPIAASWDPSGWQNAIILEAKHALSTRNNGTSSVILYPGYGAYYGGDWNYVQDPGGASALSAMLGHYNPGDIGSYGFWTEDWLTLSCGTYVGHGGYCKFFADLVQYRATGGAKGFLPSNTSATGSVDYVNAGDIIQIPQYVGHTAIVIQVLARDGQNKVTSVDVIDANYIGGNGHFVIARHPISNPALQSYRTYH